LVVVVVILCQPNQPNLPSQQPASPARPETFISPPSSSACPACQPSLPATNSQPNQRAASQPQGFWLESGLTPECCCRPASPACPASQLSQPANLSQSNSQRSPAQPVQQLQFCSPASQPPASRGDFDSNPLPPKRCHRPASPDSRPSQPSPTQPVSSAVSPGRAHACRLLFPMIIFYSNSFFPILLPWMSDFEPRKWTMWLNFCSESKFEV
jgi:hypothetical protein